MTKLDNLSLEHLLSADSEIIPVITSGEEDNNEPFILYPAVLPLLPLRNMVLFPGVIMPVSVGRPSSIKLIEDMENSGGPIAVSTQTDARLETPGQNDIPYWSSSARTQVLQNARRQLHCYIAGPSPRGHRSCRGNRSLP